MHSICFQWHAHELLFSIPWININTYLASQSGCETLNLNMRNVRSRKSQKHIKFASFFPNCNGKMFCFKFFKMKNARFWLDLMRHFLKWKSMDAAQKGHLQQIVLSQVLGIFTKGLKKWKTGNLNFMFCLYLNYIIILFWDHRYTQVLIS